jgi:hypothetical protein
MENNMNLDFARDLKDLLERYGVDLVTGPYGAGVYIAFVEQDLTDFTEDDCHLHLDSDYINVDLLDTLIVEEKFLRELEANNLDAE